MKSQLIFAVVSFLFFLNYINGQVNKTIDQILNYFYANFNKINPFVLKCCTTNITNTTRRI